MNEFVTKKIRTNKIKRKNRTKAKKIIIALWPSTCKTCVWCTSSSQLRRWIGHFKRIYTVDDKNNVLFLIVNTRKHAADELKCNAWKRSVTEIVVETTRHIHPLTSSVSLWRLYQVSLLVAYTHTKMHFCRWHTGPNVCVLLVRCQPEKKWRRKQTAINLLTKNEIHKKNNSKKKTSDRNTRAHVVFRCICAYMRLVGCCRFIYRFELINRIDTRPTFSIESVFCCCRCLSSFGVYIYILMTMWRIVVLYVALFVCAHFFTPSFACCLIFIALVRS